MPPMTLADLQRDARRQMREIDEFILEQRERVAQIKRECGLT